MNNDRIQRIVLGMLTKNISHDDGLYYTFIDIERYLARLHIDNTQILKYTVPYDNKFELTLSVSNGQLFIETTIESQNTRMGLHESGPDMYRDSLKLESLLHDRHISIAPFPDKAFCKIITEVTPGTVINLNNKMSIICVQADKDSKVFKRQFEGSLRDITLDSFKGSETYIVRNNDLRDIHYLYGKAYSARTATADIRISEIKHGEYICTDIEKGMSPNSSRTVSVGPLQLVAMKNSDSGIAWYDNTGNKIERNLAGIILGWASDTIPEIDTQRWADSEVSDGFDVVASYQYSPLLSRVKELTGAIKTNPEAYIDIVNMAFDYAKNNDGLLSLTIDDMEQDSDYNFIPVTYAFKSNGDHNQIYKITYENNQLGAWADSVKEISVKEFAEFCQRKYTQSYQSIVNLHERQIEEISLQHPDISLQSIEQMVVDAYVKKNSDYNFLGLKPEDINKLNAQTKYLVQHITDADVSAAKFIDIDGIDEDDPDLTSDF